MESQIVLVCWKEKTPILWPYDIFEGNKYEGDIGVHPEKPYSISLGTLLPKNEE